MNKRNWQPRKDGWFAEEIKSEETPMHNLCFKCGMDDQFTDFGPFHTIECKDTLMYFHERCLIAVWIHWEKFKKLKEYWDDLMK